MKKTLIALAAMATTTAFAQSTVTLSGNVKAGLAQTKYSGATAGNGSATGLADGSSRFILSGSEDLGGGLRANFQVDTRFRIDDNGAAPSASPLAGGNTFIGLAGKFGNLQIGKLDTHYCLGSDTHGTRATALQASSCGLRLCQWQFWQCCDCQRQPFRERHALHVAELQRPDLPRHLQHQLRWL